MKMYIDWGLDLTQVPPSWLVWLCFPSWKRSRHLCLGFLQRFHYIGTVNWTIDPWELTFSLSPGERGWKFHSSSNHTVVSSVNHSHPKLSRSPPRITHYNKLRYGWEGLIMNNKRCPFLLYYLGNYKGFRSCVLGSGNKDQMCEYISYYVTISQGEI